MHLSNVTDMLLFDQLLFAIADTEEVDDAGIPIEGSPGCLGTTETDEMESHAQYPVKDNQGYEVACMDDIHVFSGPGEL